MSTDWWRVWSICRNGVTQLIESDREFATCLSEAFDLVQPVFRRIADLRVSLAKHEIPGAKGVRAYAPGYARIDMLTGSLYWMIDKKDGTSEIISRRDLGDELRAIEFELPRSAV